uniref:Calponin-homology (CH) domain-containing protein n=1 Tax=Ciona savignyi TaxID=51511 RepID=H2ZJT8_CIOSA
SSDVVYGEFYDEDMPATERELAEDAPWKQIQKNTFTRWCNEHLKIINKRLGSLETDLSDGLRLIGLIEILSQKKMGKHNKRPNFRQMKLENVSVALKFLETERIKLVSIDSKAIVDGNLKLILGLIWTLILHYSISMPMWDEEEEPEEKSQATPKQRLLGWIQNKVPQMPITNFKGNWQDGTALGALVDNCAPGLCPDWEDWDPNNKIDNTAEAMKLADEWLGVPQVITPEEITNPNVDELSVMTYLSQFPKSTLKPGAPLRPKTNSKKARAYGKGVEPKGCKVGAPAPFTVETIAAGNGDVLVYLTNPEGHKEELKATPNNDKLKTFNVTYYPDMPGEYEVTILFAGAAIHKSPFKVQVDDSPADPSKVTAKGPGLMPGNIVNHPTHFDVFTAEAGAGDVDVVIEDPTGSDVPMELEEKSNGTVRATYTPQVDGPHKIYVEFTGEQVPRSPFNVDISPGMLC